MVQANTTAKQIGSNSNQEIALQHLAEYLSLYDAGEIDTTRFNQAYHEYVYLTYGNAVTRDQTYEAFGIYPDNKLLEIYRNKLQKAGERYELRVSQDIARDKIQILNPKYKFDLRSFEKAYIAGIIDGEGCIFIGKSRYRNSYQSRVSVAMACQAVPQWLKDKCGGSLLEHERPSRHHTMWTWAAGGQHAEDIIREIYSYLVEKKKEAEIFLKYREVVKRREFRHHKKKLTKRETTIRDNIIRELRRSRKQYAETI